MVSVWSVDTLRTLIVDNAGIRESEKFPDSVELSGTCRERHATTVAHLSAVSTVVRRADNELAASQYCRHSRTPPS